MEIAETNMDALGEVFVMGADMYDNPQAYALGQKKYREATWFKKIAERYLKWYYEDMDKRYVYSPRRPGQLI